MYIIASPVVKLGYSDLITISLQIVLAIFVYVSLICPKCKHHDFHRHGYYTRKVKYRRHSVTLRILRVKCMNCKSTHALLLYVYCSLLSLYEKQSSNISITPIIVVFFCIQKHLSLQSSYNIKKVILHRISC